MVRVGDRTDSSDRSPPAPDPGSDRSTPRPGPASALGTAERGQLVLLAAAVVAVALVPMALAYLQLGYSADVAAAGAHDTPGEDADRVLSRAVHEAALNASGSWTGRSRVVDRTRERLAGPIDVLRSARVEAGTAYEVSYNRSAARSWARRNCPGGPGRRFGPCVADRGVVVQDRAGETHLLAVGFDVRITTDRGVRRLTLIVRAVGERR